MKQPGKAAVLGAGVMGAQIAAHLANAGVPCDLLDVPGSSGERSQAAQAGVNRLQKIKPPPLFLPELSNLITPGNFEDDLGGLSEAGWIIEAVVENLEIKRELFRKVQEILREGTIVSSNTSGIPMAQLSEGMNTVFRAHFLGAHFFNPPRYMRLVELIPSPETRPEVFDRTAGFCREILGKSAVRCKDTPGFIANRIGTFVISFILHQAQENNYRIEEVDALTGPAAGRPKSATFRTLDVVGIDTFARVVQNLYDSLPDDEMRPYFKLPGFVSRMIKENRLGEKTGQGFYKRVRREDGQTEILALDLESFEYRPRRRAAFPSLEAAQAAGSLKERLGLLLAARDRAGDFLRKTAAAAWAYASRRIPEISDSPEDIDAAMRWGFLWEAGPFQMWDMLGVQAGAALMEQEGFKAAPWVSGRETFYDAASRQSRDPKFISLGALKKESGRAIAENPGASLIDLGEGVLCLEFHTKMNVLGDDVLKMGDLGLDKLEADYEALVIGNQGENFSAGANLMLILMLAQEEEWEDLDGAVRRFQDFNRRVKFASKPVVAALAGRALGGGCEILLHAPAVCACVESYIGLVETAAGVIPAGGGVKEMVLRALERGRQTKPLEALSEAFQTIAFAKVSTSGFEAKKIGYLRDNTAFVMNPDHLLHEAKKLALSMIARCKPPRPPKPTAFGKTLCDALGASVESLRNSGKITEYDAHIAKKLAYVMAGGSSASPREADEQNFLDLEREAFLSLCGRRETQERMRHLLKGKG